ESLYFHEPGSADLLESLVKKDAVYFGFDATHRAAFVAPEKKESSKGAGDSALVYAGAEAPALFLTALEARMTGEKSPRKKSEENPYEGFSWYRDPDFIETLARKLVAHPKGKKFLRWSPVRKYRFLLEEIYPGLLSFMKRLYRVFGKEGALSVSTLPRRFRMLQIQKGFQTKPGALEVEAGLKLLREINLLVKEGESYGRHRLLWKKILVGKKLAGRSNGTPSTEKIGTPKMDRLIFDSDLQITAYRSALTPGLLYELLALTRVKHGDHHLSFQLLPERAAHYLALGHGPGRAEVLLRREARETWSDAASEHLRLLFGSADFVRTGVRHILHTWSPSFFQRLRFLLEGAGIPYVMEEAGAARNFVFIKGADYRRARELLRRNGIFSG
ncbi:MAG: hypothetical protein JNM63_20020, partial [Spirochaetia bacterium]|nr:hypothetical protein [Spirochaetia bacterium]